MSQKLYTIVYFAAAVALNCLWCWACVTGRMTQLLRDVANIDTARLMGCGTAVGEHEWMMHIALPTLVYWFTSAVFFSADMVIVDLKRWKITYPRWNNKINLALIRKAVNFIFMNTMISFTVQLFATQELIRRFRSAEMCESQLPASATEAALLFARFVAVYFLTDIIFYTTHRLCHESSFLYQRVHKVHHQWIDTYAIDAAACHPVEHILVNLSTVTLPCIIAGVPFNLYTVWMCIAMLNTCIGHSGFKLGKVTPDSHDQHHHFLLCQYGTDVFCDRLFGTTYNDLLKRRGAKAAEVIKSE